MDLKQSTSVVIQFGPLVDPTDAVTAKTGLVSAIDHASTGILLSKNGGTRTIRHATVTASTHDSDGYYKVTLDATDTNTLGSLVVAWSSAANCLPAKKEFMVKPANIYNSQVLGSAYQQVDLTQILTVAGDVTKLAAQAKVAIVGTVNTGVNAPDLTHFSCSDLTEATASHYLTKTVYVLTGALAGQKFGVVTAYSLTGGEGYFTVSRGSPSGETLGNGDTVVMM